MDFLAVERKLKGLNLKKRMEILQRKKLKRRNPSLRQM